MDGVATRATAQGASAVLIACVTFVVLTALAMLEFPGGSLHLPGTHHYIFSENFLGDLGVTKTASGPLEHVFMCSLRHRDDLRRHLAHGLRRFVARNRREPGHPGPHGMGVQVERDRKRALLRWIGLTPWNLLPTAHNVLAWAGFALLAVFVVALLDVQRLNRWPKRYILANLLYLAVVATYLLILVSGQSTSTHNGLVLQVAAQKIMVYSSILNLGYQAYGIRKALAPRHATVQIAHR